MKAAVIGLGSMGKIHLEIYQSLDVISEIIVSDVNPETLNLIKKENPGIKTYSNPIQLFDQESLDILSVVTTSPQHAEIVFKAAEKRVKRIFCEKPIATNLADAQKMIQATENSQSLFAINHTRR